MKIPGKQAVLKYFKPLDMGDASLFDSADELEGSFGHFALEKRSDALLLNRFTPEDILKMMEEVGLIKHLQSLGFDNFQVEVSRDEALINHLKVYYETVDPAHLLINMRVSESRFVPEKSFFEDETGNVVLDMVIIEWLSAHNTVGEFTPDKPQLPGQSKPGLGSLSYLIDIIYLVGRKMLVDGFMDVPDHFHGAVMYSRKFKFFNPAHEAILQAILRDLHQYSLSDLSWGMLTQTIIDRTTGKPQVYDPSEQIFPISNFLKEYFQSRKYQEKFQKIYRSKGYYLDYETMLKRKAELLRTKKIEDL